MMVCVEMMVVMLIYAVVRLELIYLSDPIFYDLSNTKAEHCTYENGVANKGRHGQYEHT